MPDIEDFTPAMLSAGNPLSSVLKVHNRCSRGSASHVGIVPFSAERRQFFSVLKHGASWGDLL